MSVRGKRGVGIPSVLLHEAEGTVVSIEFKSGVLARGILHESEDNMNCHMKNIELTDTDGKVTKASEMCGWCWCWSGSVCVCLSPSPCLSPSTVKQLTPLNTSSLFR